MCLGNDIAFKLSIITFKQFMCKTTPGAKKWQKKKRTTPGIRWSSPTQLLVWRSPVYLRESGRDPEFSGAYGRTWYVLY